MPEISVVMAAHNEALLLEATMSGILSQEGALFEFIVVDDGSTDATGRLLDDYAAKDARVRIVHQENQGLTRALIQGCSLARGEFIAREDVGDVSLPRRLQKQRDWLSGRPDAALVSCRTRVVGPEGEHLHDLIVEEAEAAKALLTLREKRLRTPGPHGSVMFRRWAYTQVGGYRPEFYFAQDLDLWVRMAEVGRLTVIPEVLYKVRIGLDSISSRYRREQMTLARLIVESARLRRAGISDVGVMKKAKEIGPSQGGRIGRLQRSRALYFIGSCLRARDQDTAAKYFRQAIRANPLHVRSWYRLLL